MSIANMLRMKLSLNAERNWHQNSGANRRDVINVRNMMAGAPQTEANGRLNFNSPSSGGVSPGRRRDPSRSYCRV